MKKSTQYLKWITLMVAVVFIIILSTHNESQLEVTKVETTENLAEVGNQWLRAELLAHLIRLP